MSLENITPYKNSSQDKKHQIASMFNNIAGRYDFLKEYQVKVRHYILPGAMADGWGQTIPI